MFRLSLCSFALSNSFTRPVLGAGFLIVLALALFAISPIANAVTPPPDGAYPNNNTAEGNDALFNLTTGHTNTAIGNSALFRDTTGSGNTAIGNATLPSNTIGNLNTVTGSIAMQSNTTGNRNTATGAAALFSNTTGSKNTANGLSALGGNITGVENTATGNQAMFINRTGNNNTANGAGTLASNTTGSRNTATGWNALGGGDFSSPNTGNDNMASGVQALFSNTSGNLNTADGALALRRNTTGSRNIALGQRAGVNLTTGNNNIDIGNPGVADESGQIRIGASGVHTGTFIAGIRGATVENGIPVVVGLQGQLGTLTSSVRFKEAIKPMDKASEAILALKPVTFRYKQELDPDGIPQFGLVAEEVEKVNPDLVVRDDEGKVMSVRYEAVNAMLLNEFLKEHRKVEEQQATIGELKSAVAAQRKQIETLTATVQKVSEKTELSKAVLQVVANDN